jgi:hypothetical protein
MFIGVELLRIDSTNNKSSVDDILGYIDNKEDKDEYWKR